MPSAAHALARVTGVLFALAMTVVAVPASALLLTTSGTWDNAGPRDHPLLHGVGTNVLSWGPRTGFSALDYWLQSSYSFTGQTATDFALPMDAGATSRFVLGTFIHHNAMIGLGAIEQADLTIGVSLSGGTSLLVDLASTFYHDETPNTRRASADTVTLDPVPTATVFSHEGVTYKLELVGFLEPDLGETMVQSQPPRGAGGPSETVLRRLATAENRTSRHLLQAQITRVPEPGTLSLLGLGLLGIAIVLRRTKRQAT